MSDRYPASCPKRTWTPAPPWQLISVAEVLRRPEHLCHEPHVILEGFATDVVKKIVDRLASVLHGFPNYLVDESGECSGAVLWAN
jgi:hypothetical protein